MWSVRGYRRRKSERLSRAWRPLWHENIRKDLLAGHDVLVVAHGNSLRGLVKEIDGIDDSTIERVAVPNGIPLVYRFEQVNNDLQVVER